MNLLADAVLGSFIAGILLTFFIVTLTRIARDTRSHRRGV